MTRADSLAASCIAARAHALWSTSVLLPVVIMPHASGRKAQPPPPPGAPDANRLVPPPPPGPLPPGLNETAGQGDWSGMRGAALDVSGPTHCAEGIGKTSAGFGYVAQDWSGGGMP